MSLKKPFNHSVEVIIIRGKKYKYINEFNGKEMISDKPLSLDKFKQFSEIHFELLEEIPAEDTETISPKKYKYVDKISGVEIISDKLENINQYAKIRFEEIQQSNSFFTGKTGTVVEFIPKKYKYVNKFSGKEIITNKKLSFEEYKKFSEIQFFLLEEIPSVPKKYEYIDTFSKKKIFSDKILEHLKQYAEILFEEIPAKAYVQLDNTRRYFDTTFLFYKDIILTNGEVAQVNKVLSNNRYEVLVNNIPKIISLKDIQHFNPGFRLNNVVLTNGNRVVITQIRGKMLDALTMDSRTGRYVYNAIISIDDLANIKIEEECEDEDDWCYTVWENGEPSLVPKSPKSKLYTDEDEAEFIYTENDELISDEEGFIRGSDDEGEIGENYDYTEKPGDGEQVAGFKDTQRTGTSYDSGATSKDEEKMRKKIDRIIKIVKKDGEPKNLNEIIARKNIDMALELLKDSNEIDDIITAVLYAKYSNIPISKPKKFIKAIGTKIKLSKDFEKVVAKILAINFSDSIDIFTPLGKRLCSQCKEGSTKGWCQQCKKYTTSECISPFTTSLPKNEKCIKWDIKQRDALNNLKNELNARSDTSSNPNKRQIYKDAADNIFRLPFYIRETTDKDKRTKLYDIYKKIMNTIKGVKPDSEFLSYLEEQITETRKKVADEYAYFLSICLEGELKSYFKKTREPIQSKIPPERLEPLERVFEEIVRIFLMTRDTDIICDLIKESANRINKAYKHVLDNIWDLGNIPHDYIPDEPHISDVDKVKMLTPEELGKKNKPKKDEDDIGKKYIFQNVYKGYSNFSEDVSRILGDIREIRKQEQKHFIIIEPHEEKELQERMNKIKLDSEMETPTQETQIETQFQEMNLEEESSSSSTKRKRKQKEPQLFIKKRKSKK